MERTLCPRGLVACSLNPQFQGAIVVGFACGDLIGCCQSQRNLLRPKHFE
jgi:hypothetical protein